MLDMLYEGVLPAISRQMALEKDSLSAVSGLELPEEADLKAFIGRLAKAKAELLRGAESLAALRSRITDLPARERADAIVNEVVPLMQSTRDKCDAVELIISADIWPYPIYRNLLSLST